ncbi:hypothetical protein PAXRUDRAFT_11433 [Paxillus rubicundulus Ve08.2h10]|uniref:RRM domain-containing protein n=1 Tax=Paxillus rubicundulus Ve08.2h10 TaxID=930991 RepID=A0A0D0DRC1_9AGAM|nr:hypothetical protein PAXRUDRAFT_11433 [Paxillus rubicundulus Ve08.2h10]
MSNSFLSAMPKSEKKIDKKSRSDKKGLVKKANSSTKSKPVPVPASSKEILLKAAKLADASSDSSSDEAPTKSSAPTPAKKVPVKKASISSSSSSDSSSDEEPAKPSAPMPAKKNSPKKASTSESSSDSSSDEEPAKSSAITPSKKVLEKKASTSESSSDSSSDEEPKKPSMTTPAPKKTTKGPSMSESSSDDSSDSSNSSDDDEDKNKNEDVDIAEVAPAKAINKRKADSEAVAPQKKVRLENGNSSTVTSGEEIKSIFVGRLSWNVDNDWLAQEFAECGEIESAHVQMDRNTGRSRGFGHVHFKSADAVEKALAMNGKEIDGRAVNIDKSTPPDKRVASEKRAQAFGDAPSSPSTVLFVGNLSFGVNEDTLWETFGEHGDVKSVRVPTDRESGKPKGFAYVEFSNIEAAQKAHEALHGFELDGRSLRLDFSQPRDGAGGRGGGQGGRGGRGRGGFSSDRGGFSSDRGGFRGERGRGGNRGGRGGDRGGRGGRGRGGARTGGITQFEGQKIRFD